MINKLVLKIQDLVSPDNYVEKGKIRRQRRKMEDLIPK